MRYESSVTSLSWIPSEAVTGASRLAFGSGFAHYDDPPPAKLDDIQELAEYGPGAMLGERAHLEGGTRTSTLVAVTDCRVASAEAAQFDHGALTELSGGHRREGDGPA